MTKDRKSDAMLAFRDLKHLMLLLEGEGYRPNLIVHANGMPDRIEILPAHATTPQVDAIRAAKKSELSTAHAA